MRPTSCTTIARRQRVLDIVRANPGISMAGIIGLMQDEQPRSVRRAVDHLSATRYIRTSGRGALSAWRIVPDGEMLFGEPRPAPARSVSIPSAPVYAPGVRATVHEHAHMSVGPSPTDARPGRGQISEDWAARRQGITLPTRLPYLRERGVR